MWYLMNLLPKLDKHCMNPQLFGSGMMPADLHRSVLIFPALLLLLVLSRGASLVVLVVLCSLVDALVGALVGTWVVVAWVDVGASVIIFPPRRTEFIVFNNGYFSPHLPLKSSVSTDHIMAPPRFIFLTYSDFSAIDLIISKFKIDYYFFLLLSLTNHQDLILTEYCRSRPIGYPS